MSAPTGPRAGLGGMSGAGLLVVGTYCAGTAAIIVTICTLAILERSIPEEVNDLSGIMVAGIGLLLAKTWADRPSSGAEDPPEYVEGSDLPYDDPRQGIPLTSEKRKRRRTVALNPQKVADRPLTGIAADIAAEQDRP